MAFSNLNGGTISADRRKQPFLMNAHVRPAQAQLDATMPWAHQPTKTPLPCSFHSGSIYAFVKSHLATWVWI